MRFYRGLRISLLRLGLAAQAFALLAACGNLLVRSEGSEGDLMLGGHDAVAYFTAGRPTPGRADIKVEHRGATYRFASDESRRQFITSPEKYVPQFGGFCANGMVYSVPVAGASRSFKIVDGKLYLFGGARSRLYFEMDQERNLKLAWHYWEAEVKDANWRLQYLKRQLFRVPHYKTNAQLAEDYEKRFGRPPA